MSATLKLIPDAHAWEEWVMGVSSKGRAVSVHINSNSREIIWRPPPSPVLASTPAAVPFRGSKAMVLRQGTRELRDTWHMPQPSVPRGAVLRYLDDLPDSCR